MTANELRIGNWVLANNCVITQIEPNDILSIYQCDISNKGNVFEPIALTPEILEKCGFENVSGVWYGEINIYKYEDAYQLCVDEFGKLDCYIKHLHQLQNLVFSLTGTELNVQL